MVRSTGLSVLLVVLSWTVFQYVFGNPCSVLDAEYFDGKCFKIFWDEIPLEQAKGICTENWNAGGRLAEPKTDPQFLFLRKMAMRDVHPTVSGSGIYIGGTCNTTDFYLTWSDGSPVTSSYWLPGNPDHYLGIESCLEIRTSDGSFTMNDVRCNRSAFFACESFIGDICESSMPDSEYYKGQCFKIHNELQSWNGAIATCTDAGGFLAEPRTEDIYDFLVSFINTAVGENAAREYLIGLTDKIKKGDFRWLSDDGTLTINKWNDGEPNNSNSENQVAISSDLGKLLDINAVKKSYYFICQKKSIIFHTYLAVVPTSIFAYDTAVTLSITASEPVPAFVRVTQTDGHGSGSIQMASDIKEAHGAYVPITKLFHITSSGISTTYVEINSTHLVTVIMYYEMFSSSNQLSDIASTLIFSTSMLAENYFLTSHSAIPLARMITITAKEANTQVTISMFANVNQDFVLKVKLFEFTQTRSATVLLDKYETALIEVISFTQAFIHGTKPIAVFTSTQMNIDGKTTNSDLEMLIPAAYMETKYVTFPSWSQNPTDQTEEKIQILAIQDNTVVQIYDGNNQNITLPKAGDFREIFIPISQFCFIESNVPVQLMKLSPDAAFGCTIQLMPSSMWRNEYSIMSPTLPQDVQTAVIFVISESNFDRNVQSQSQSCQIIEGTSLFGCILTSVSIHTPNTVYTISAASPLIVYQAWVDDSGRTRSCFPWGVNNLSVTNIELNFDVEAYMEQAEPSCVFPTSVMNDMSTTTTTTTTTTTGDITTSFTAVDDSTVTNNNDIVATAPNFLVEVEKLKDLIEKELRVELKDTYAFKRTKMSIPDSRPSSTAIGLFGAALMVAVFGLILLADISRVMAWFTH